MSPAGIKKSSVPALLVALLLISALSGCQVFYGVFGGPFSYKKRPSDAQLAGELRAKGEFGEAVKHYQDHMQARLADPRRPIDENPYFYYLLIGDTYLDAGEPKQALESYHLAADNKVENEFIVDRITRLSRWYQEQGKLETARTLLQEHRELDSLVMDGLVDELNRAIVAEEDLARLKAKNKKPK